MLSDYQLVYALQHYVIDNPFTASSAVFAARWLILIFVFIGVSFLIAHDRRLRHAASEMVWSFLTALLVTNLIAVFVQRERPFIQSFRELFEVVTLIPPPITTSFPSGHTATAFALASAVFYANRRLGILAYLVAVIIGFARIAVGVHFPTDVIAGVFVGLASFAAVRYCHERLRARDMERAAKRHVHV
jgi:undecaprenyl-diphosphatase